VPAAKRKAVISAPVVIDAPVGRGRAGLALTVLVTFVGVTIALAIAGSVFVVAEGVRSSVR
jgi:hypothetical protein